MTKAKGYILPFFIPHLGCPGKCIFCNQNVISGKQKQPTAEEILMAMEDNKDKKCQLAFYGGSFTAMKPSTQNYYLETAKIGLEKGWISGVRISTRPDCINEEVIKRLQEYGVDTVELGVQSLKDKTLLVSKRGHLANDSIRSVKMLLDSGFTVGVQLMPGLPFDDEESIIKGANEILSLKPHLLRIYPTVVVENTELATMYRNNEYQPLSLDEAVIISAKIMLLAEHYGVKVIRTGLNTDEKLEKDILAGPYHSAFGNLVKSYIWRQIVLSAMERFKEINGLEFTIKKHKVSIYSAKNMLPLIFGQNSCNKSYYDDVIDNIDLKIKSFNEKIYADDEFVIICGEDLKTVQYSYGNYLTDFKKKLNI